MASTKLRKTFQYPTGDSEDDETPKDLDEEEQDKLIQELRVNDQRRNEQYTQVLLVLSIIAAIAFVPTLFRAPVFKMRLVCLLSISSLSTNATVLFTDSTIRQEEQMEPKSTQKRPSDLLSQRAMRLNGLLGLLLSLNAYAFKARPGIPEYFWMMCLLPLSLYLVTILSVRLMSSVDVDELEKLKYGYKGA